MTIDKIKTNNNNNNNGCCRHDNNYNRFADACTFAHRYVMYVGKKSGGEGGWTVRGQNKENI